LYYLKKTVDKTQIKRRLNYPFVQQVPILDKGCFQMGACTVAKFVRGTVQANRDKRKQPRGQNGKRTLCTRQHSRPSPQL